MESGGWSGRGERLCGIRIDGLVAFPIKFPPGVIAFTFDVRRKGHLSERFRQVGDRTVLNKGKFHQILPIWVFFEDLCRKIPWMAKRGPFLKPFARFQEGPPAEGMTGVGAQEETFGGATSGALSKEACLKDRDIISKTTVVALEKVWQIFKGMVAHLAVFTVDDQKPGLVPAVGGNLGDGLRWEVVVELGGIHAKNVGEEISAGKKT
jgi:hypothetical protein